MKWYQSIDFFLLSDSRLSLPAYAMTNTETPSNDSLSVDAQLNPYHLHYPYSSLRNLITQPLLGASNYSSWCKAMLIALLNKNKEGLIYGTLKKPERRKFIVWKCNNDTITFWILNLVSNEIAASINYTEWTPYSVQPSYLPIINPHIYQLCKLLVTMSQEFNRDESIIQ